MIRSQSGCNRCLRAPVDRASPEQVVPRLLSLLQSVPSQPFSATVAAALRLRLRGPLRPNLDTAQVERERFSLSAAPFLSGPWDLGASVYKVQVPEKATFLRGCVARGFTSASPTGRFPEHENGLSRPLVLPLGLSRARHSDQSQHESPALPPPHDISGLIAWARREEWRGALSGAARPPQRQGLRRRRHLPG